MEIPSDGQCALTAKPRTAMAREHSALRLDPTGEILKAEHLGPDSQKGGARHALKQKLESAYGRRLVAGEPGFGLNCNPARALDRLLALAAGAEICIKLSGADASHMAGPSGCGSVAGRALAGTAALGVGMAACDSRSRFPAILCTRLDWFEKLPGEDARARMLGETPLRSTGSTTRS